MGPWLTPTPSPPFRVGCPSLSSWFEARSHASSEWNSMEITATPACTFLHTHLIHLPLWHQEAGTKLDPTWQALPGGDQEEKAAQWLGAGLPWARSGCLNALRKETKHRCAPGPRTGRVSPCPYRIKPQSRSLSQLGFNLTVQPHLPPSGPRAPSGLVTPSSNMAQHPPGLSGFVGAVPSASNTLLCFSPWQAPSRCYDRPQPMQETGGSIPGSGGSPGRGNGNPLSHSCS